VRALEEQRLKRLGLIDCRIADLRDSLRYWRTSCTGKISRVLVSRRLPPSGGLIRATFAEPRRADGRLLKARVLVAPGGRAGLGRGTGRGLGHPGCDAGAESGIGSVERSELKGGDTPCAGALLR
jgi:hypothetical protein